MLYMLYIHSLKILMQFNNISRYIPYSHCCSDIQLESEHLYRTIIIYITTQPAKVKLNKGGAYYHNKL